MLPKFGFGTGHEATYEWFVAQGWADRVEPLVDPVWKATWDFDGEAKFAASL
jgi:hypothetical protein